MSMRVDYRKRCVVRGVMPSGREVEVLRYGVSAAELGEKLERRHRQVRSQRRARARVARAEALLHGEDGLMVDASKLDPTANPWHPMNVPTDVKTIGKLIEELTELAAAASRAASAASRCLIQGIDEAEPVTGVINRAWLEDEIADVRANLFLTVERFGLDEVRMTERIVKKMRHLRSWHAQA